MSIEEITRLTNELDTLAGEADRLHALLTKDILGFWRGDAAEACLRESRDNRECAEEAIGTFRNWLMERSGQDRIPKDKTLPDSFLL